MSFAELKVLKRLNKSRSLPSSFKEELPKYYLNIQYTSGVLDSAVQKKVLS